MKKAALGLLLMMGIVAACATPKPLPGPPRPAPRPEAAPVPPPPPPKAPVSYCDCQWWAKYNNTSPCRSGTPLCFKFIAWRDVNACERDLGICAAKKPSIE